MPSVLGLRFALLSAFAASALAQTELQSLLSVSGLDAPQSTQISTAFAADIGTYYGGLATEPGYSDAFSAVITAMPTSVVASQAADPELFFASLAEASSDDLPDWFTAMPTSVQQFWSSVGEQVVEMYTSEVNVARPLPSSVSASLSSVSASLSSQAAAVSSSASEAVQKGEAPTSPATSGHMAVIAGGVAIAAGLVGMAML
ncbi:MAG: hypothetical protein Q9181_003995 [Wetmoreana brouardii]